MTTKIICNFVLRGGTMLAHAECENPAHPEKSGSFEHRSIKIFNKKIGRPEYIDYYVRKTKDAHQTLNISDVAYEHMISNESNYDAGYKKEEWKKMNENQRLTAHISIIANELHAKSFSFEVLPD